MQILDTAKKVSFFHMCKRKFSKSSIFISISMDAVHHLSKPVMIDNGLDEFGSPCVVAVRVVCASEVHEDDACAGRGVRSEIVEESLVSMGCVVSIAVAE